MVSDTDIGGCALPETDGSVLFLPAESAPEQIGRAFVGMVRNKNELFQWLDRPPAGLQWLQVEGLLSDPDAWAQAAHGDSAVALDVVLAAPVVEFSDLYRLVDVCAVRDVRASVPASPGFSKAIRVAAALRLPVRLLPGQPTPEVLRELQETLHFYLRDPMVESPVEFFHSVLAFMSGADTGSMWMILEEDPAIFLHHGSDGRPRLPRSSEFLPDDQSGTRFVENHLKGLIEKNAECASCPWQVICRGYFKWPDATYNCGGVKQLFSAIKDAAEEMGLELTRRDQAQSNDGSRRSGDEVSLPTGSCR